MNFFIQQHIVINTIKIEGIANSSVFQIGSAGVIKPLSNLYNTGGFTEAAPKIPIPGQQTPPARTRPIPFVPLVTPA